MKISRVVPLAFLFAFFATAIHAQFGMIKYKDVQALKDKQLIVIINPPNQDVIHKYDRKGKVEMIQEYNQIIGNYNDNMKFLVKRFWNFNSREILFKTRSEVEDMTHNKIDRDKYLLMYCYSLETEYKRDMDWVIDKNGERVVGTRTAFAIGFPGSSPFCVYFLVDLIPSPTVLAYYISTTNYNYNYVFNHPLNKNDLSSVADENAPILSTKKLLVLKEKVSPKIWDKMNTIYPCNIKLVDENEMQNAITSGDTTAAYITYNGGIIWAINCADGATLACTRKGTEEYAFGTAGCLKEDFFKDMASYCTAGLKK